MADSSPNSSIAPSNDPHSNEVLAALGALLKAVQEMNPAHARPIPPHPVRFNLLSRPSRSAQTCRICNFPGHHGDSIHYAGACKAAMVSMVGFWEDIAAHLALLYREHQLFQTAIKNNKPTYDMRLDNAPAIAGNMETVLVGRLTRSYLKFQSHCSGLRPKLLHILSEGDKHRYCAITNTLNDFLLNGSTLTELFERSLAERQ
ncbi:uncharacterized protein BDR25DRAFT_379143 [Lindgomyces ingoldianus]|uniref:Uncharacterized protein n=1 Tax=Lindgomyces ingoldianus TaxID=673940 RepID=A0ACB6R8Z8_9PLEO|nr:uncharacterized protein BDR25DRAFT_379143 [Lindgomyces ingoldianus]KAF2475651.1 hypothetical protein BDR25DRAFT_379143 [Lindgomyces ingoldianus]